MYAYLHQQSSAERALLVQRIAECVAQPVAQAVCPRHLTKRVIRYELTTSMLMTKLFGLLGNGCSHSHTVEPDLYIWHTRKSYQSTNPAKARNKHLDTMAENAS